MMKSMTLKMCVVVLMASTLPAQDEYSSEHLKQAEALHRRVLVLDTHSDVTPKFENSSWNFSERHESGHMDIPRLREGGFGCQFLSIWMGKTPGEGRAIRTALVRIDAAHETIRKYPEHLALASTAEDIRRIYREGRIACLMGIEGGHIIEDSLPALRMFYRLGCRYMTLTHGFNLSWADSSGTSKDEPNALGGLNQRGEEIVREMNRLGMMVDISHVSSETFDDALRVSKAPLIASHSSVNGVFEHRRNLSDEQLKALAKGGGIVMINFFSGYIDPEWAALRKVWEKKHKVELGALAKKFKANRQAYWAARTKFAAKNPMPQTSLTVLARHVEHAAKIAGWDHVGMGADWDGVSALPKGIKHCGDTAKLTALLLARGATEKQLEGFLGANFLRTMEKVERVAKDLQAAESKK